MKVVKGSTFIARDSILRGLPPKQQIRGVSPDRSLSEVRFCKKRTW